MSEPLVSGKDEQRRSFGYTIAGPILVDMLYRLYLHLHGSGKEEPPLVFFCARGGLTLRRALERFAGNAGLKVQTQAEDFMVSRLAAFRTAFHVDPAAIAPLASMELSGRTCSEAARAIAGIDLRGDPDWDVPFSIARWEELIRQTESGRQVFAASREQADLLRRHVDILRRGKRRIVLCDTGVFGSILRYLQVGVPTVDWRLTLLFRANYKRIPAPHFRAAVGVVSEENFYVPWKPMTVALLYWQLIESMLEPSVPSVRFYRQEAGRIVSDLERTGWRDQLARPSTSILAGAYAYLDELTPNSLASIGSRAEVAWRRLRRKIVYPTADDVALLSVGKRPYDFGMDGCAEFTDQSETVGKSLMAKLSLAKESMWPEGEVRKQLPRTANLVFAGWELGRAIRALSRPWHSALVQEDRPA